MTFEPLRSGRELRLIYQVAGDFHRALFVFELDAEKDQSRNPSRVRK